MRKGPIMREKDETEYCIIFFTPKETHQTYSKPIEFGNQNGLNEEFRSIEVTEIKTGGMSEYSYKWIFIQVNDKE
jgi:hypothetical protein